MTNRKHPIHHLHKIKVHHNRWLLWALSYALIVAIAVVGYIKVSDVNFDTDLIADNNYRAWHSYKDQRLGFMLRYPADWSIEAESDTSIIFEPTDSEDSGVTVTVTDIGFEKSIRNSLNISGEKKVTVGGVSGVQIQNDLGDRHYESVVILKHDSKLFVLRGTKRYVDQLSETFSFLPVR